jgi:hypothetical protein
LREWSSSRPKTALTTANRQIICLWQKSPASQLAPELFQAKWTPVRIKKTRQIKNLELRFDSIETKL